MGQTRLAVIEDGSLCELYYERPGMENLSGNIYLGRVEKVLPGMNAAFVDIGKEKNGFLCAGNIGTDLQGDQAVSQQLKGTRIEKMVRPGQQLMVQVIKSQTGAKGPRLSCHVTLPGRTMVLMPGVSCVSVSKKIEEDAVRTRLYAAGRSLMAREGMGLILRTAAQNAPEETLSKEYDALCTMWRELSIRAEHSLAPRLIHSDTSLALRAVRDSLSDSVDTLWVDDSALMETLRHLAAVYAPEWIDRICLHDGPTPLFDLYRVDDQADKALQKHVWLKNGGSLVIEQTEALTVIDVNTGKFTGKHNLDDTIFRSNCEAAREIMRQMRLRDLGGIIIVDFIAMRREEDRQKLLDILREEARRDRTHVGVVGMTNLGLVEMTRKKLRQPLAAQVMHICPDCGGNGVVPSHETVARKIEREIWRRRRAGETNSILIEAAAPVCGWMKTLGAPREDGFMRTPYRNGMLPNTVFRRRMRARCPMEQYC